MRVNFENIDRAFRSKLKNYYQPAPDDVWKGIEEHLIKENKKKQFPYYKIAAAIAVFAILGSVMFYQTTNKNEIENESLTAVVKSNGEPIIQENNISKKPNKEIQSVAVANKTNTVKEKREKNIALIQRNKEVLTSDNVDSTRKEDHVERLYAQQIVLDREKVELDIVDLRKERIENYLNTLPDIYSSYAINDIPEPETKTDENWSVGGEFSPLYSYRYISQTNNDSKNYYDQNEKPIMSYTGGVNVQYRAFKKLTIQAGVYYSKMGQSLNYMSVYANQAYDLVDEKYKDRYVNSYNIENSIGEVSFNSKYVIVDNKSDRVENLSNTKGLVDLDNPLYNNLEAEIQQSFKYIEVPFLLRYKLIDKALDFNLVGGIGANFLVGNDVYVIYGGNKEIVGSTNGVNSINYNGTLGFGIEYPIWQRINIRIEPSVKYYLNQINSNSAVESHPYSFGLYTGINYSF